MTHSFSEDGILNLTSFSIFLMNSILNIDCRINELKLLIKSDCIKDEHKKDVLKRIETLIATRMSLAFSLLDIQKRTDADITYSNLKRTI